MKDKKTAIGQKAHSCFSFMGDLQPPYVSKDNYFL